MSPLFWSIAGAVTSNTLRLKRATVLQYIACVAQYEFGATACACEGQCFYSSTYQVSKHSGSFTVCTSPPSGLVIWPNLPTARTPTPALNRWRVPEDERPCFLRRSL